MNTFQWQYKTKIPQEMRRRFPHFSDSLVQLLFNRGLLAQNSLQTFLQPDFDQHVHDPFLFRDMEKAVERVQKAVRDREKIIAHGDYDADGVCGAAVLYEGLKWLGANVEPYIPHREKEGYGLNKDTINSFGAQETKLLITADCGISNVAEIDLAKELGIDVIVTDHHQQPLQLPSSAHSIINPCVSGETYPFKGLAGVGVAYKLISALYQKHAPSHLPKGAEKWLLDLVAISTITDMMPLVGENRILVKYGMLVLRKTRRSGLRALARFLKTPIERFTFHHIGFQIGPRLNAAGRLKHARLAFELLTCEDELQAEMCVQKLDQVNQDRRSICDLIVSEVESQIGVVSPEEKVLFAYGKDWPIGVVGLVANKISQKYQRPVFILGEAEGNIVASGRSIPSLNIVDVLKESSQYYTKYGGHAAACGFTLKHAEDIDEWKQFVRDIVGRKVSEVSAVPVLEIDVAASLKDIDWSFWSYVSKLEPFGQQNPKPVFVSEKVRVKSIDAVGRTSQHLRLVVEAEGVLQSCIGFGFGEWAGKIVPGALIDIAYEIDVNEWNDEQNLQLKLLDIHYE